MSPSCARHPDVVAVEVCSRCGAFTCPRCVAYLDAATPVCEPCQALLTRAVPGWRGRLGVWAAGLGVLGMLAGLRIPGRPGVWVWAVAAPLGLAGGALCGLELRRLRREGARPAGQRLVRLGLALGVAHGVLVLLLAASFAAYLRVHPGGR